MRIPRIYDANMPQEVGAEFTLDAFGANHISKVLRLKAGDKIFVFDGRGHEFEAELTESGKKTIAKLTNECERSVESPVQVELLQVISRGDRMDFTIQKAVELGISKIIPLTSSRCGVKLDGDRAQKKIESYQRIAISACEQCGRNFVPEVTSITTLANFIKEHSATSDTQSLCDEHGFINLTLDPRAQRKITDLPSTGKYRILIGPEGGFSDDEVELANQAGFTGVTLGPRILRTETAALVTLSILGSHFGDL